MASTSTPVPQSEIETKYPFDEIAPPSTSGSAKSSSMLNNLPCPVFINHRGPDVKETVAKSIYHALHHRGVGAFLDSEELLLGDFLPEALQQAMTSASLHVAIFSPGYAQSPWCLAELSFMLQTGTPIVPVFYGVQPTDLRWVEKGAYAEAFAKHEEKGRYSEQKIQEWKMALHNVSYYMGEIINSNDEEQEKLKVKNIVNGILETVKVVSSSIAKYPVGLEDAVINFELFLKKSQDLRNKVQMVGIWGMGGVGKTTLAKEFYNKMHKTVVYSGFSFVTDIREAAANKRLHKKQKVLLKELGIAKIPHFDNIEKGKEILLNRLRPIHALIVLDDVDCQTQLDDLLPMKDSLALNSLIIVTTREREVLEYWSISSIYKMEPMNSFYAKQLFCWHAFSQESPLLGFDELATKFANSCNGLPLSLKVLGSQLRFNTDKEIWEDLWHKVSKILSDDIKNRLKVSYDALDDLEKQMFLDAACFFIGEDYMKAIAVWEGSGWSSLNGSYGLKRLVNKCLIDLDEKKMIKMHDHLRDLGTEIASTQSPYRLWSPDQIAAFQKQDQDKIQIRGMILNCADKGVNKFPGFLLNTTGPFPGFFSSTRKSFPFEPQIFVFEGNDRDKLPIAGSSRELAWLSCTGIADRNLPLTMENLRVLELHYCSKLVGLWKDGPRAPWQLRMLIIDGCPKLQRIPKSMGLLKNLKQISLSSSYKLKGLPEELCCLQSLEHLQLNDCRNLKSLPSSFGELGNLRHLVLSNLESLKNLPDSFKQLKLLQHLNLAGCYRLGLQPDIMQNMTSLECLNISGCSQLKELPCHITYQIGLKELYAEYICLRRLPVDIGQLSKLRVMKIASQALSESFGGLNHLEHLELTSLEVESLPQSFNQLNNLQTLEIRKSRIRELDFGRGEYTSSLYNLQKITLSETEVYKISISEECCPRLKTVKVLWSGCLREAQILPTTMEDIQMQRCPELIVFLCSASLRKIVLSSLQKIEKIENLQECTSLEYMRIMDCPQLNVLPSFENLASLQEIAVNVLHQIDNIDGLQILASMKKFKVDVLHKSEKIDGLQHCTSLEYILIMGCPQLNVLSSFAKLASLIMVGLHGLHKIKEIEGFQHCTSLEYMEITDCPQLSVLQSFAELSSLNYFELKGVHKIEKIEGLENCTSLKFIIIEDCPKLRVLGCFEKLASLKTFIVRKCKKLENVEGLKHCSELDQLMVENTCLGVPSIENLGSRTLQLVDPCIPKIQKHTWQRELIVCPKAVTGTGSVLNSSEFPRLTVLHSFANKKIPHSKTLTFEVGGKFSSNENSTLIYLLINCVSPSLRLAIERKAPSIWWDADIEMENGRWILVGLFSPVMYKEKFSITCRDSSPNCIKVEKGLLLTGEENHVAEAFWRMLARLGN